MLSGNYDNVLFGGGFCSPLRFENVTFSPMSMTGVQLGSTATDVMILDGVVFEDVGEAGEIFFEVS